MSSDTAIGDEIDFNRSFEATDFVTPPEFLEAKSCHEKVFDVYLDNLAVRVATVSQSAAYMIAEAHIHEKGYERSGLVPTLPGIAVGWIPGSEIKVTDPIVIQDTLRPSHVRPRAAQLIASRAIRSSHPELGLFKETFTAPIETTEIFRDKPRKKVSIRRILVPNPDFTV